MTISDHLCDLYLSDLEQKLLETQQKLGQEQVSVSLQCCLTVKEIQHKAHAQIHCTFVNAV